jgi:hypothetical protein
MQWFELRGGFKKMQLSSDTCIPSTKIVHKWSLFIKKTSQLTKSTQDHQQYDYFIKFYQFDRDRLLFFTSGFVDLMTFKIRKFCETAMMNFLAN